MRLVLALLVGVVLGGAGTFVWTKHAPARAELSLLAEHVCPPAGDDDPYEGADDAQYAVQFTDEVTPGGAANEGTRDRSQLVTLSPGQTDPLLDRVLVGGVNVGATDMGESSPGDSRTAADVDAFEEGFQNYQRALETLRTR